ncbi:MAG TPA: ABC transporter substrate-binding protein [Methylomirabilota bacterium]|jgi:putative ABC transport system substrate-binding protein
MAAVFARDTAGGMMTRRVALAVTLAVLAVPFASAAPSPGQIAKIGVLDQTPLTNDPHLRLIWEAFTGGLREHGWIENQNVVFERRSAAEGPDRYSRPAAELVALQPDVIVTGLGEPAILALKKATTSIPIVMLVSADPVGSGLVASLARPGGNVTGMSILAAEMGGKRLAILKEAISSATRVAVLWNAAYPGKTAEFKATEATAGALKVTLLSVEVRGASDFSRAFSALERLRPDAIVAFSDPLTVLNRRKIVEFAVRQRLPLISELRQFAEAGALMSYGASLTDLFRRAAGHVDKILRGAKPADLPVEQPTKFELIVNMKTAKALGLTIPPSLLLQADQVIE